jgi:hypothetical protein
MRISTLTISVIAMALAAGNAMADDQSSYQNNSTPVTERGTDPSIEEGQDMNPGEQVENQQVEGQSADTARTNPAARPSSQTSSQTSSQKQHPQHSQSKSQSTTGSTVSAPSSQEDVSEHAVIEFNAGQDTLTKAEAEELREAVKDARDDGAIQRVEIAAWADSAAPTTGNLSVNERSLAMKRAEQIKSELRKISGEFGDIKVYNMADGSHWLSRTLNAEEAELDSVFGRRNEAQQAQQEIMDREDFEIFKDNGEPSKAVVLFKTQEK